MLKAYMMEKPLKLHCTLVLFSRMWETKAKVSISSYLYIRIEGSEIKCIRLD